MAKDLVTMSVSFVVDSDKSEGVLNLNNNATSIVLHKGNGEKFLAECVGLNVTKISGFSDDLEEIVRYDNSPDFNYKSTKDERLKSSDVIKLDEMGEFVIILIPNIPFLYNIEDCVRIDMGERVMTLEHVKAFLEENYANYKVLRKIT